jgi:hypothetical protein
MFSLFKSDPVKKLTRKYKRLMEEARDIQRTGDLRLYAQKISQAEDIAQQIEALKSK